MAGVHRAFQRYLFNGPILSADIPRQHLGPTKKAVQNPTVKGPAIIVMPTSIGATPLIMGEESISYGKG